jgi:hypothetical protein
MLSLPFRQVHIDFHTSEHITGVESMFDPDRFVTLIQEAQVNSVNLFAKCPHGWSYANASGWSVPPAGSLFDRHPTRIHDFKRLGPNADFPSKWIIQGA